MGRVVCYCDEKGKTPVLEWLHDLRKTNKAAYASCRSRIEMLGTFGHELRRPLADVLERGIHELRARRGQVQLRILYFFGGPGLAVLSHGFIKKGRGVPLAEIERAAIRRKEFRRNPGAHTAEMDL